MFRLIAAIVAGLSLGVAANATALEVDGQWYWVPPHYTGPAVYQIALPGTPTYWYPWRNVTVVDHWYP